MFYDHNITVVIPAHNEEETITQVVHDFGAVNCVDRVIVVENNCSDATAELAAEAGATVIQESAPGYGCALRAGMDYATANGADILILTEADGSFVGKDLWKLAYYLLDANMVLGTRTTKQMVQQGANMDAKLRWGNVSMAKLLELFWFFPHEPRLTDVGCTYRAIWAADWERMRAGTTESGPSFSPEMICEAFRLGLRTVEIPVHYGSRRGGQSKHSDSFGKVCGTAYGMFKTILRKRFRA